MVRGARRICQSRFRGEPVARLVLAEDVENGIRVGRRLDAADIHLLQLFHVGEDLRDLRLKLRDLLLAQVQARELRGVADIELGTHRGGE